VKWIFFVLLGLNLVLASMQWWDIRGSEGQSRYIKNTDSKQLVLLREQSVPLQLQIDASEQQCELVGPMSDKALAENLLTQLSKDGISASLVVQPMQKAPGYWVYFGPIADKESRLAKLREFQSNGIDSYIITSGKLKGAISVGVFENIDSAHRMKKSMSEHGYQSELSEIEKQSEAYWLLVSESYLIENKKKIENILKSIEVRPEMRQIFCKSVASEKQFP